MEDKAKEIHFKELKKKYLKQLEKEEERRSSIKDNFPNPLFTPSPDK